MNGFIKSMVMVVKQIMIRSDQADEDTHLVMLAYRVTPRGPGKFSPAKAMAQCKIRVVLPIRQHLPVRLKESRAIMLQQWQKHTEYYNQAACQLPELQWG